MAVSSRQERLIRQLQEIARDLSGCPVEELKPEVTFLELGFDSLFLTQLSTAYKKAFGIQITFRQLFDQYPSMNALSALIDSVLPADQPVEATAATLTPKGTAATTQPKPPSLLSQPVSEVDSATRTEARRAAAPPEPRPVPRSGQPLNGLEAILIQQLELMAEQLRVLESAGYTEGDQRESRPESGEHASVVGPPANQIGQAARAEKPADVVQSPAQAGFGPGSPQAKDAQHLVPAAQEAHLKSLIERYTRKTNGSKERTQRFRRVLADPRTAAGFNRRWKEMVYPIWVERSRGSRLWDVDGNEYIDLLNGFGPNLFGHSADFVVAALERQLSLGFEVGPQTPLVGEAAEMVCRLTGMDRASFVCTGSEAVQAAMRLSRTITGRDKVVLFSRDYHGNFDQVLVREANRAGRLRTMPSAPGIPLQSVDDTYVLEYGAEESLEIVRRYADEIAAVLVEPIQSRRPEFRPKEFLQALRALTQEKGILLIFDEVVTGFRVAPGGAQEYYGIEADLSTYGKVAAGGMPIGIVAGREAVMNTFDGGYWEYGDDSYPGAGVTFFAGTFVRHPLAIAAAHASLKHMLQEGPELQRRVSEKADRFAAEVNRLFSEYQTKLELAQFSSIMHLRNREESELAGLFHFHLRYRGVHIQEGFPCYMTDAHSESDIKDLLESIESSIVSMADAGILGQQVAERQAPVERSLENGSLQTAVTAHRPICAQISATGKTELTEAQRELWIASQLGQEASCAFNESCSIQLRGQLDEDALRQAIAHLIQRHEALRLRFAVDGSGQTVEELRPAEIPTVDLSGLDVPERDARLQGILTEEGTRQFDLANGPLIRCQIVSLAPQEHHLVLTVHHIACDGWSYDILLRELGELYNAFRGVEQNRLPPATPFREYVAWQRGKLASDEGKEAEAYWSSRFQSLPEPLELPCDQPRPSTRSFRGARVTRQLTSNLTRAIRQAASKEKATLFNVLFAGYAALLCRLSGQRDLIVGVPAAGQNLMDSESLVGHCSNLLPIRTQLKLEQPFREYLRAVQELVLDAYDYQLYTYGLILQKVRVARDAGRPPLVSALFNLDPPLGQIHFEGLVHEVKMNPRQCYQFDIGFNIVDEGGTLSVECDFNTDLFCSATIERWLGHYQALLQSFVTSPETSLGLMPLLAGAERERILTGLNDTCIEFGGEPTVHKIIAKRAADVPERIAVECGENRLTYFDIDQRSSELCRFLSFNGVRPGVVVGLCMGRSVELVVALLGVLKAGGAYLPIDPEFPQDRISFMIEDSGVAIVLTEEQTLMQLPANAQSIAVCLDRDDLIQGKESIDGIAAEAGLEDLAYLIYTSGSTGRPKGVEITHRALTNFLRSMERTPGLCSDDAILAVTTLSFDIAALEIFLPLMVGAKVIVASRAAVLDPSLLATLMERSGATVLQATPSTWRMLRNFGWAGNQSLKALCGGEALSLDLAEWLLARCGELWNMYGPTETTVWSAVRRVEPERRITIGRPIANTTLYVVDDQLQPTPIGVVGELLIGGSGLARGYHRRPELTAEKFISHPFSEVAGERVFRTGDLARLLPDHEIEVLGRNDSQIKLHGHRIELGEIEAIIAKHPRVRENVVIAREDSPGRKQLVAYVCVRKSEEEPAVRLDSHWGQVWEKTFDAALAECRQGRGDLLNLDEIVVGWSGNQRAREEVQEWIHCSVERLRSLNPQRVLEIGCGTGQILLRLAPDCPEYWATDIAKPAIDALQSHIDVHQNELESVHLLQRSADDFHGLPESHFDTVIINSVAQYFPSADYLARVVEGAVRLVRPGGTVFIGDLQSYSLMEMYHVIQLLASDSSLSTISELRQRVRLRLAEDEELVVDPEFFYAIQRKLTQISAVDVQMRRGRLHNETTQFHYDAILYVDGGVQIYPPSAWTNWAESGLNLEAVRQALGDHGTSDLALRNVPNSRLARFAEVYGLYLSGQMEDRLDGMRTKLAGAPEGVDPEDLWTLAESMGWEVELRWNGSGANGQMDAVFRRPNPEARRVSLAPMTFAPEMVWTDFANQPRTHGLAEKAAHDIIDFAKRQLPDYMVPTAVVILDSIPTTPNGKINRAALPAPLHNSVIEGDAFEEPRGETEEMLAAIWRSVLEVERIGRQDDFFALGGTSILGVLVFNQIHQKLGKRYPMALLFQTPTIAGLSAAINGRIKMEGGVSSLVSITQCENGRNLFLIHGAGGNVLIYRELAKRLNGEASVFGLQSRGLNGDQAPLGTIEEMARAYLSEIRQAQPHGPYYIGGYCMGGTVAYEIARLFEQLGEPVELVAMLDTYNFSKVASRSTSSTFRQKLRFHAGNLAQLAVSQMPGYLRNKFQVARDGEFSTLWDSIRSKLPGASDSEPSPLKSVTALNDSAAEKYVPGPYSGRITLFKPRTNYEFYSDPQMGWGELVGGVDIVDLPVNPHAMLVEPFVSHLSMELKLHFVGQVPERK